MIEEKGHFRPPEGPEIDTLFLIDRGEMRSNYLISKFNNNLEDLKNNLQHLFWF